RARLLRAMSGLKERARTLIELIDSAAFLVAERPLQLDEKAASILDADGKAVLGQLLPELRKVEDWNAASTEAAVRAFAEANGLKLGKVAQPLRAALTGRSTSPGVFDVLDVLGRDESLMRMEDQIG
ncbi:MAG: glutamate--tRNA ligase, partial [Rhizobiaceae bacterium]